MFEKSKPVEIIGVDSETLEKDLAFPEAYAFYIRLSDEPDALWQRYLAEWKDALNSMKRGISVEGNKLRLVFVYGDNIESCVKYATGLVKMINERVVKHNRQVELEEKKYMAEQEVDRKKEEELRGKLRELEPEPMPAVVEVTVEEFLSAYEADEEAADAKFTDKILKLTGVVGRIEVKDMLDIYCIILTSAERNLLQNVRCMFDKEHGDDLSELKKGETVTVQGKFDGSIVDIRMRNCVLVR